MVRNVKQTRIILTVSVIIPTKNEGEYLDRCLKSIKNSNYQIIIVDNHSKDITRSIAKKYTPFVYIKGAERSEQRNYGAVKAKGNFLLFLDADMELSIAVVNEAILLAKDNNSIVAFPEQSVGVNFWEKSLALERNLYKNNRLLAGARFFPKKIFTKIGGYDENLVAGEDWDITQRAKRFGIKVKFTKTPLIHNERVKNIKSLFVKKRYYIKHINRYKQKNLRAYIKQSSLTYRLGIFMKKWKLLIKDPLHFLGFLFIKTIIWYDWKRFE